MLKSKTVRENIKTQCGLFIKSDGVWAIRHQREVRNYRNEGIFNRCNRIEWWLDVNQRNVFLLYYLKPIKASKVELIEDKYTECSFKWNWKFCGKHSGG